MEITEKPGASTPWTGINQLLGPDERFEIQGSNGNGFLLAPKHASQLAALLFLLHQQGLSFHVQGKGTTSFPQPCHSLVVSVRAFSQIILHEQGVVEVGAGCPLSHLHQFLFERKQEVALEENPLSSPKRSVGGFLLSGRTAGISYRQETISNTILGIELVTLEGSQLKWGGRQRSALAGPALHKLIVGLKSFPGIVIKVFLKTYPTPQRRLRLAWSFRQKEALWDHVKALKKLTSTWECLDFVLSGNPSDQGFVFAQISGLEKEMEAFLHLCPSYSKARQGGEKESLKNFLKQQKLNVFSVSLDQSLEPGEYLWHQELDKRAWWMTSQLLTENDTQSNPAWKQRLFSSLYPDRRNDG